MCGCGSKPDVTVYLNEYPLGPVRGNLPESAFIGCHMCCQRWIMASEFLMEIEFYDKNWLRRETLSSYFNRLQFINRLQYI